MKSQANGPCKKCGADEWYRQKNGTRMCKPCQRARVRAGRARRDGPEKLWTRARDRARAAGLPFDITVDDVRAVYSDRCPVTNVRWGPGPLAASLDRLRPSRGYVKGNIAVLSLRANMVKSDADSKLVLALYRWMRRKGL